MHLSESRGEVAAGFKGAGRILDDQGGSGPVVDARPEKNDYIAGPLNTTVF